VEGNRRGDLCGRGIRYETFSCGFVIFRLLCYLDGASAGISLLPPFVLFGTEFLVVCLVCP
jgi:hypothetical protein